jgi:UDP-glucose 4-epimerase
MKPALAWVLGKGGLLGSHLARAVKAQLPHTDCWDCVVPQFCWRDSALLSAQFKQAVRAFATTVQRDYGSWMVLWAAGAGVVGSTEEVLQAETRNWGLLLQLLGQHLGGLENRPGLVFLASSAGGVYGNSPDQPLTETSPCSPVSAYGRYKLEQEQALLAWADAHPHTTCLIGRVSNLYGPGQKLDKPQGLISQISQRLIYHCPVHIYVPLDTVRDYIFAEDCARQIVRCLARLADTTAFDPANRRVVKIFASEQATSIAQIVGIFSSIAAKQHPRMIRVPTLLSSKQPKKLQFRSVIWRDVDAAPNTPLPVGINRVHQHLLAVYRQGGLSPPGK